MRGPAYFSSIYNIIQKLIILSVSLFYNEINHCCLKMNELKCRTLATKMISMQLRIFPKIATFFFFFFFSR